MSSFDTLNLLQIDTMKSIEFVRPNEKLMKYVKEYLCVGGLPDVVNVFNLTHDLTQVREIQKSILESYKDDFGKHLNNFEIEFSYHNYQ